MYGPHSATQTSAAAIKMSSSIGANLDRRELIAIDCESLKLCFLLRPTSHSGIVTLYGTIIRALFIALPSRAHRRGTGFLQQQQQLARLSRERRYLRMVGGGVRAMVGN